MQIAEAFVRISPDLSAFKREASAKLRTAASQLDGKVSVDVGVKVDSRGLRSEIRDAVRRVARVNATVGLRVDASRLASEVRAAVRAAGRDLDAEVDLKADGSGLRGEVNRAVKAATGGKDAVVPLNAEGKGFRAQVARMVAMAEAGQSVDIPLNVKADSTKAATRAFDELKKSLSGNMVEARQFQSSMDLLRQPVIPAALIGIAQALSAVGAASVGTASSLAPLVGLLGTLPGAAVAAVQGLGVLGFALMGMKDVLKALNEQWVLEQDGSGRAAKAANQDAQIRRQAARQILAAQRGVEDAQRRVSEQARDSAAAQQRAVRGLADSEQQSARRIADAARAIGDARRRQTDTARRTAEETERATRTQADAVEALADAQEDAARTVEDAQRQQVDAQRALTDAQEAGTDAVADAVRRAADAAQDLADAQTQGVADAADAIARAADAAQDLADAQEDAAKRVADAQRDVVDSTAELEQVQSRAAQRVADATDDVSQAQQALRQVQLEAVDAQQLLNAARAEAVRQLEELRLEVARSAVDEAEAARAAEKARARLARLEGAQENRDEFAIVDARLELADAEQTYAEAQAQRRQQTEQLADADRKGVEQSDPVLDAVRSIADAQKDAADAASDLARAQTDLGQAQRDAASDVADAQRKIADATRDAADAQDEAASRVGDAAERAAEAQAGVAEAQQRAARSLADAQLRVADAADTSADAQADASQRVADAQQDLVDATADAARAQVDAVDRVADAREALANAQQASTQAAVDAGHAQQDAARDLADAERDAADARVDATRDVADAQENLRTVQEDSARAQVDAARGIAEAQESLALAQEDAAARIEQGAAAAFTTANKLRDALAGVSPAGERFARFLASFIPLINEIQAEVQGALFPGLESGITAAMANLPVFRAGLSGLAAVFGDVADSFGRMLGSPEWGADLASQFAMNERHTYALGGGLINLFNALRNVMVAAQPLSDWLVGTVTGWAAWIANAAEAGRESGALAGFFERTMDVADQLFRILGNVGSALWDIGVAAQPLGDWILDEIEKLTVKLSAWTDSVSGGQALSDYFEGSKPAITAVAGLLGDITTAIFNVSQGPGFVELVDQIRSTLIPALETMFAQIGTGFGPAIIDAFSQIIRLIGNLGTGGGGLTAFAETLGIMASALNLLLEEVPGLGQLISYLIGLSAATRAISFFALNTGLGQLVGIFTKGAGAAKALKMGFVGIETATDASRSTKIVAFAGRIGASLTSMATAAARAVGSVIISLGRMAASWATAAARSLVSAGRTALAWTISTGAAMAGAVASGLAALGTLVAGWVVAGTQSLIQAARVAAAWVLAMGPIGWITIAVIAIVALIVANWDTIKRATLELWNRVTDVTKRAWESIKGFFRAGIDVVVRLWTAGWNAVSKFFRDTWDGIASFWSRKWREYETNFRVGVEVVKLLWERGWTAIRDFFTSTWNAITGFFTRAWEGFTTALRVGLEWVGRTWNAAWTAARDFFVGAWNGITSDFRRLWEGLRALVSASLDWVLRTWSSAWGAVRSFFSDTWNNIVNDFRRYWEGLRSTLSAGLDWMKDRWERAFRATYDFFRDRWNDITSFFGTVRQNLEGTLSGLVSRFGELWDTLREKFAAPIRFIVNTVFNDGLRAGLNAVASIIPGLGEIPRIVLPFASGGRVPGQGNRDTVPAVLTPGEFVVRKKAVQAIGVDQLRAINSVGSRMAADQHFNRGGAVQRFYGGGIVEVGKAIKAMGARVTEHPAFGGVLGTHSRTGGHYTGDAIDINYGPGGENNVEKAFMDTRLIPWIRQNVANYRQLLWRVGGHFNHAHLSQLPGQSMRLAPGAGGTAAGAAQTGPGGVVGFLRDQAANAVNGVLGPIRNGVRDFTAANPGFYGRALGGAATASMDKFVDWIRGRADSAEGATGPGAGPVGGAERWRGLVSQELQEIGQPQASLNWVLRLINRESGGNPRAINNWDSNARRGDPSRGLMQTIGGTFNRHKSPRHANDIYDPQANIHAGLAYGVSRYGSVANIPGIRSMMQGGGYKPYAKGAVFKHKTAIPGAMLAETPRSRPELITPLETIKQGLRQVMAEQRPSKTASPFDGAVINLNDGVDVDLLLDRMSFRMAGR